MKKLRNVYFILGLFAFVFALLTKHIPGVTATDFIRGFCDGLASALLLAGVVTATIPYFYRNDKHGGKGTPAHAEEHASKDHATGKHTSVEPASGEPAVPDDPAI